MRLASAIFTNAMDADFSLWIFPIGNTTYSYSMNLFSAASNQLLALSSQQLLTVGIIHAYPIPHLQYSEQTKNQQRHSQVDLINFVRDWN